ncbi:MAG: hypothetical protein KA368_00470 [Acidobacteria bacterium]|nr:hypothetical protein [Acidobacteriota bacterium]
MSEELKDLTSAYRRAGFGLGLAAIGWTLGLLFAKGQMESSYWLIPIAAAALSVLCFSRSRQSKEEAK